MVTIAIEAGWLKAVRGGDWGWGRGAEAMEAHMATSLTESRKPPHFAMPLNAEKGDNKRNCYIHALVPTIKF